MVLLVLPSFETSFSPDILIFRTGTRFSPGKASRLSSSLSPSCSGRWHAWPSSWCALRGAIARPLNAAAAACWRAAMPVWAAAAEAAWPRFPWPTCQRRRHCRHCILLRLPLPCHNQRNWIRDHLLHLEIARSRRLLARTVLEISAGRFCRFLRLSSFLSVWYWHPVSAFIRTVLGPMYLCWILFAHSIFNSISD